MFNNLFTNDTQTPTCKEGDLFKTLEIFGHRFDILYGYYEQYERENPNIDPMPIYPDFITDPLYTISGEPFVTKMQDACKYYKGKPSKFAECGECSHYHHGDDFIGKCNCPANKKPD